MNKDIESEEAGFVTSELNANTGGKMSYASVPTNQAESGHASSLNTLDEPVIDTIKRDLLKIWEKVQQVLLPRGNKSILKDWDLWGPLLLCLVLASFLGARAPSGQSSMVFTGVFFIVWCGAGVVTVNGKLLGGKLSFFQSVCVLGYCLFPLVVASIINPIVGIRFIKAIISAIAFVWSSYASVGFLGELNLEQRRILAIYPIILFYFILGWIIFVT